MRNKSLPYLVVLSVILILSNLSYALTGYKTGLPLDQYYLYSATWDGSKWNVSTTLMKVVRDPSSGLNTKLEKSLTTTGSSLPTAPNETREWYLNRSKSYADQLNNALKSILPNILKSQNDTSSRVVADLAIRTSDGKEVHYIASYDGNNGYRSYGFQASLPNLALFSYYSKGFDEIISPPPGIQWLKNVPQRKLGKYDYIIYKLNGEVIYQESDVDVNGKYDSVDDSGVKRFVNEVVLPKMNQYNVSSSVVRYMYKTRPTLDSNGFYKYRVSVPYRAVITDCEDRPNFERYSDSNNACLYMSGINLKPLPRMTTIFLLGGKNLGEAFMHYYAVVPGDTNNCYHSNGYEYYIPLYSDRCVYDTLTGTSFPCGKDLVGGGRYYSFPGGLSEYGVYYTFFYGEWRPFFEYGGHIDAGCSKTYYSNIFSCSFGGKGYSYTYDYYLDPVYDCTTDSNGVQTCTLVRYDVKQRIVSYTKGSAGGEGDCYVGPIEFTNVNNPSGASGRYFVPLADTHGIVGTVGDSSVVSSSQKPKDYVANLYLSNYVKENYFPPGRRGDEVRLIMKDGSTETITYVITWDQVITDPSQKDSPYYIDNVRKNPYFIDNILKRVDTYETVTRGYGVACRLKDSAGGKYFSVCSGTYEEFSSIGAFTFSTDPVPPRVKFFSETIEFEYESEADVKLYLVSINGDMTFLGYTTEKGYLSKFSVSKSVYLPQGSKLDYYNDKIISIKNDSNEIVPYTSEGVESVGPLKVIR